MRRLFRSVFAFTVLAAPVLAQESATYNVQGTNLDGSSYGGTATITLLSDSTCSIEWTTGSSTSQGICMKYQNAFAAGYVLGDEIGLVIYEIMRDGSLRGQWTVAGSNGVGSEILTPQ